MGIKNWIPHQPEAKPDDCCNNEADNCVSSCQCVSSVLSHNDSVHRVAAGGSSKNRKPTGRNLWSPAYHIQVDRSGSQSTAQSLRQQQKTDADAELTLQHGIVLITPPSTPHSETARLIADDLSATVARRLSRDRRGDQTRITSQTNPQMMTSTSPAISSSPM